MTTGQATSETTSNGGQRRPGEPRAVASSCEASSGAPNKRVLPTAHYEPDANPLDPMRRQTRQSLDRLGERQATSFQAQDAGHHQRLRVH